MGNTNTQVNLQLLAAQSEVNRVERTAEEERKKQNKIIAATLVLLSVQARKTVKGSAKMMQSSVAPLINNDSSTSKSGGSDNNGYPVDPNSKGMPAWITQILQEIKDGDLKGIELVQKLQSVIDYFNTNKDANSTMGLVQVLIAISSMWKNYSGDTKTTLSAMMANLADMKGPNGQPFPMMLAKFLRDAKFYASGGSKEETEAFIDKILQQLNSCSSNAFISKLKAAMENVKGSLPDFFEEHLKDGKPDLDSTTAFWILDGDGSTKYGLDGMYSFASSLDFHSQFMIYVKNLINQVLKTHKNGSEVIMLLIALIFGRMDKQQMDVGAYSDMNNDLSGASELVNEIQKIFQKDETITNGQSGWNPDDLKKMMKDIHNLLNEFNAQKGRFGSLGSALTNYFSNLLNQKISGTPDGTITFDQAFMKWQETGNNEYLASMTNALKSWAPDPSNPNKTITIYNNIINAFKSALPRINDKSSVVNNEIQQIVSNLQSEIGTSKDIFDKWSTWSQTIVQALARANA